jgi:hypothetical protein
LAGSRLAGILHKSMDTIPSKSTLRRNTVITQIVASPGQPTKNEVQKNTLACFEGLVDLVQGMKVVHQVLMLDELKVEERPRWDDKTNMILGTCREHGKNTSLEFNSKHEAELLVKALQAGDVHLAVEVRIVVRNDSDFIIILTLLYYQATVGALGIMTSERRIYSARPVLISGSCKRESGSEHARLVRTTLDGIRATKLRTICIASDGESRRGEALILETFKHELDSNSPIYQYLGRGPSLCAACTSPSKK